MKNGVETIITDQQMINKETGKYYEDLYVNIQDLELAKFKLAKPYCFY